MPLYRPESPVRDLAVLGTLTLPDGASWSATGLVDAATYVTASTPVLNLTPTWSFSSTAADLSVFTLAPTYNPTGATFGNTIGAMRIFPVMAASAVNGTGITSLVVFTPLGTGYTGSFQNNIAIQAGIQAWAGTTVPTSLNVAFNAAGTSNGNGVTSGTVNNIQYRTAALSAAAGVGGTVNNTAALFQVPSGSSAGTTNIALSITGNGGAASTNWAINSTSTAPSALAGSLTVARGVASGTALAVGGVASVAVSASDSVTAVTSNNTFISFAQTYSIPASSINAGTVVKVRVGVRVSDASGTDTLTCQIRLGTTSLIATTAVDPGATTDIHMLEFELVGRAAASASSAIIGFGRWITNTGGTIAHGTGLLGSTNFATNGALVIDVQAKWSSNTANTACLLEMFNVEVAG